MALGEQFIATAYNDYVQQGSYKEVLSGFLLGYKLGAYSDTPVAIIRAGGFVRWGDAVIPAVQLDYRPFSFAVSYDVNLSKLSKTTNGNGGYELSVTYAGFLDRENSSVNAVRCPHF